jgi:hypothetical protein
MIKKQLTSLCLAIFFLAIAVFNLGMAVSRDHYIEKISALEKQVDELKQRKSVIIHQVDNAGGMMYGKITDKQIISGHYTVTAGAYGKFLVTKSQYDNLEIGDDIPEYLKQRGN